MQHRSEPPGRVSTVAEGRMRRRLPRWQLVAALAGVGVTLLAVIAVALVVVLPWWTDGASTPAPTTLAAGRQHTCTIRPDRTVACWGGNGSGQLGTGSTAPSTIPLPVPDLTDVVSLAAGGEHTCALTAAGAVWCWGDNASGQLGTGTTSPSPVPAQVSGLERGVLSVTTSESHSCALLGDRSVRCWGDNGSAQLGTGNTMASSIPVPVEDMPARSTGVAVGNGFTCVGFTGRTIRCWGENGDGQLGLGDLRPRTRWEPVIGLPRTGFVAVGDAHACSITQDGVVMCWGANRAGQLGIGLDAQSALAPMGIAGLEGRFTSVAAGYDSSCALSEAGDVTCWGGTHGVPGTEPAPVRQVPLPRAQAVAVGSFHACAATDDGIYCWGNNGSGQLGSGGGADSVDPVRVVEG